MLCRWTIGLGLMPDHTTACPAKVERRIVRGRRSARGKRHSAQKSQTPHFDDHMGVYMLAVDYPRKAFYVGIAASGKNAEGIGTRIRKHRVKLTASHVGGNKPCGTPLGVGGVNHPEGWREFARERHDAQFAAGIIDQCADVRLMVGTARDNIKKDLEKFESAIMYDVGAIQNRIFDLLWPGEHNRGVLILNTVRGGAPDRLPGTIVLPED